MADLKLIALDSEDLTVFSAHLQDAVLRMDDLAYFADEKRFATVVNRFDWESTGQAGGRVERRRSALRFEHVRKAQVQGLDLGAKDTVLSLLAIQFEETDPPGGIVTLIFAGDGGIRLDVECIEAELRDLGPAWQTKSRPSHKIVDNDSTTGGDAD